MIGLIWAQARDAAGRPVIGADGAIPWHVPEDFAHFKRTTAGHPVVMGRLTWASLPPRARPLPGRTNVVVTRRGEDEIRETGAPTRRDDVRVAPSVPVALAAAASAPGGDEVWVMGGSGIYAEAVALADRLVVTEVDVEVAGDAFAPPVDSRWRLVEAGEWAVSSGHGGLRFRTLTYAAR